MTTWTTFETIDESENWDEFYIDRLGVHQYRQDERTRFKLERHEGATFDFGEANIRAFTWVAHDYSPEDDEDESSIGSMREVIRWVAGRILYGA
jgi:hypothetical protein